MRKIMQPDAVKYITGYLRSLPSRYPIEKSGLLKEQNVKKAASIILSLMILFSFVSCKNKDDADVQLKASDVQEIISFYFSSNTVNDENFIRSEVDATRNVVIVELKDSSKEKQNEFIHNVFSSSTGSTYITYLKNHAMLVFENTAGKENSTPAAADVPYYDVNGGCVQHAEQFDTIEEIIQAVNTVKSSGPDKMTHSEDFPLYDKDYLCLMSQLPFLPDYQVESVMLYFQGAAVYFLDKEYNTSRFMWTYGGGNDANKQSTIDQCRLMRYGDTKYYCGKDSINNLIYWWENGNEFSFEYPVDTDIPLDKILPQLVVATYTID